MARLLGIGDLPAGFDYPRRFVLVTELGFGYLGPWEFLMGDELFERHRGLARRYPGRTLVPFARRSDNDDVACWEPAVSPTGVVVVHDFASPGWENRKGFDDFDAWLRQALDEFLEWLRDETS